MAPQSKTKRGSAIYGIWRVDDERSRTHCWIVRIQRRQKVWRRSFSDGIHGGKTNALRAARAFRDEVLSLHQPMTRAEYANIRRRNNQSGVPGVCHHVASTISSGRPAARTYWIAFWTTPDGKPVRRKFSIRKFGDEGAFKHAKASRRQGVAALNGPYVTSPGLKNWIRRHRPLLVY